MSIPGIGENFHWWHAVTGVSGVSLVACIGAGWPNGATIAAGMAAVGIGQWINHPLRTRVFPDRSYTTAYPWSRGVLGLIVITAGLAVAGLGTFRALF